MLSNIAEQTAHGDVVRLLDNGKLLSNWDARKVVFTISLINTTKLLDKGNRVKQFVKLLSKKPVSSNFVRFISKIN